jgi:hypothetical protein
MREIDMHHAPLSVDGGYRIFSGQMPHRDFQISYGHVVCYLQSLFFNIFGGFSWKAVAMHVAVVGAIATVIIYIILRTFLKAVISLVFAAIAAFTFYTPRAIPWWDETAYIFYLIALAAFIFAYRYAHKLKSPTIVWFAALSGLALTASVFSKQNIGFVAFVLTSPAWLIISFNDKDQFTDRAKRFIVCTSFFLLSMFFLSMYFVSHGDFFKDTLQTTGQLDRFLKLLPNAALKEWLSFDYGKIVLLVYVSLIVLPASISYLLNLNLKEVLRDRLLVGYIISLVGVGYVAQLTSLSGAFTAFSLFSLLLGLLFALISKIKHYGLRVEHKRLSNICLIMSLGAVLIFLLWGITYNKMPYSRSRLIQVDIFFLTVMFIIAVIFIVIGLIYRKSKGTPFLSASAIFIWSKIWVLLLAVSLVIYYGYFNNLHIKGIVEQVILGKKSKVLAQFNNIPALKGVYTDKEMVKSVEDLYLWFHPKLARDSSLKNGKGIYIFPNGQSLYGILGVRSYIGVQLFLGDKVTFNQPDPDTNIILKDPPKYIIMYSADDNVKKKIEKYMLKLLEFLEENYILANQFGEILVFQHVSEEEKFRAIDNLL